MNDYHFLMLEGWTPMLLIGLAAGVILFFVSKKISKKSITITAISLTIAYIAAATYGYFVVNGWEGIGILALSTIILFFSWLGLLLGYVTKARTRA